MIILFLIFLGTTIEVFESSCTVNISTNSAQRFHFIHIFANTAQSCPTLSDPMDCSLRGSSIHGIFQTRVLEWVAIAFSKLIHSSVCVCVYIYIYICQSQILNSSHPTPLLVAWYPNICYLCLSISALKVSLSTPSL